MARGSGSVRCPDCGMDPATIVAFERIGPVEPPKPPPPRARVRRKTMERRLAKLEAEAAALREQLRDDQEGGGEA